MSVAQDDSPVGERSPQSMTQAHGVSRLFARPHPPCHIPQWPMVPGRGKGRPTQAPGINIFIYFAMLGSESWAFCLLDSSTTEPHP